jgi:hypothetical protein
MPETKPRGKAPSSASGVGTSTHRGGTSNGVGWAERPSTSTVASAVNRAVATPRPSKTGATMRIVAGLARRDHRQDREVARRPHAQPEIEFGVARAGLDSRLARRTTTACGAEHAATGPDERARSTDLEDPVVVVVVVDAERGQRRSRGARWRSPQRERDGHRLG